MLHISSLPGRHGVGDLGAEAATFARFLRAAGQRWWQMFPLGPPGISNSPYQVLSAFAGNPLFINLDDLAAQGLLSKGEVRPFVPSKFSAVDFDAAWRFKKNRLRKAFGAFERGKKSQHNAFEHFCRKHRAWLDDYALYCALKEKFRGLSWEKWPDPYRLRRRAALEVARADLRLLIRYHQFLQFQFFRQWRRLRAQCDELGIGLIGDVPIFVAHDSADVWAHPELFWLDKKGSPIYVAGCPPDYFSSTGQRWGNPLYRWPVLKRSGYAWWVERFRTNFELFDALRLDHFIGFQRYWEIPASHRTAINGKYRPGPGDDLFNVVFKKIGRRPLIAEDLGAVTPEVTMMRDRLFLPGMRVLQFAFGSDSANPFLPHNHIRNSVVYTGTHDNDTTVGWFESLKAADKRQVLAYAHSNGREIHWDLIRLALASVGNTAIIPMQDLLGLGTDARMNLPGTQSGNWQWRMNPGSLTPALAERLAGLTRLYGRS